jgi:hypothetical protein
MDRVERGAGRKEDANKQERGEREGEDSPNQEVMMKTITTLLPYVHREERRVKAGHHYSNLLAAPHFWTNKQKGTTRNARKDLGRRKRNERKDWGSPLSAL